MSLSVETLAVARKYTDDSLAGAGAVAGVPCKIQSITAITGGNRVTFLWTDNNGDDHTSAMDVMNGVDGEDGKGIQSVSINAQNHLIITYTDGTTVDAGQIEIHSSVDSVNGQTGAVVLDAEDVGALPDNTPIPSKTSDLTNDSGFATTSDVSTALADYTKTADLTTLLAAKQDTLTFDNAPTENSNNPVKSGGVYSAERNIYEVMSEMGAKNKEPFDIDVVKALNTTGTWTGNSYELNGITFAFADDGKVTVSGTASALCSITISGNYDLNGGYIITGCPSGGGGSTYSLRIYDSSATVVADDVGEGVSFTANNLTNCRTNLIVRKDAAISTPIVFAPMIRDSKDTDNTYQPYAKTNIQLTQDTTGLIDNMMENGAVNYIYPINSTNTDSAGVTWTLNSDNSVSVSSGGIAPSTGTGFIYRNNNAAFLRGKTVTFKANVTGNTPTYDKLYFAVICRETESGANLVRYDLWPIVGQTEVTFTVPDNTNYVLIGCNIQNGATTAIDCKISPIVSLASYNGSYVPYAKTNKELTDFVSDVETLTDTTQITVADSSALTINDVRLTKKGNVLCGFVVIQCKAALQYNTPLFTLPTGFRPSAFCNIIGVEATTNAPEINMFGLWSSGIVQLQNGVASASKSYRIQISGII